MLKIHNSKNLFIAKNNIKIFNFEKHKSLFLFKSFCVKFLLDNLYTFIINILRLSFNKL